MSQWDESSTWEGHGLRREVFFFSSRDVQLYGSLFVASEPSRPFGLLACGSWGVDADRTDALLRSAALAMAKLGGAGLVFHYPGYGDSYGDLAEVDLDDLRDAAVDAASEAARRCPELDWILAGFMFGGSVASLARSHTAGEQLLLVQPALRPGSYFRTLAKRSEPLAPGPTPREMMTSGSTPGMAYGYPVPARVRERADEADAEVAAALAGFDGEGTAIGYPLREREEPEPLPERFGRIEVPGRWYFGAENHPRLAAAVAAWLDERTAGEAR
ncbi:MAG TPA: hypothetical protein VFU04_02665 [Solirubrobacterales bacterium]|nr:hypothetical protein [Solirubrobacterales bacterium]